MPGAPEGQAPGAAPRRIHHDGARGARGHVDPHPRGLGAHRDRDRLPVRVPRGVGRHPQPRFAARVAHLDEAGEARRSDQRRARRQLEIVGDGRGARAHDEELLGVVAAREPDRVDPRRRVGVHQRAPARRPEAAPAKARRTSARRPSPATPTAIGPAASRGKLAMTRREGPRDRPRLSGAARAVSANPAPSGTTGERLASASSRAAAGRRAMVAIALSSALKAASLKPESASAVASAQSISVWIACAFAARIARCGIARGRACKRTMFAPSLDGMIAPV